MAFLFERGNADRINPPSTFAITSGPFSMAAWIYPVTDTEITIIGGNTGAPQFRRNTGGALALIKQSVTAMASSGGSCPLNVWSHAGLTYDGSNIVFYINGANVGTGTSSQTFTAGQISIGRASNGEDFDGRITDVAVWRSVLSAPEMALISKRMRPADVRFRSLLFYYRFNEGSGRIAIDYSLNGNTGLGSDFGSGCPSYVVDPPLLPQPFHRRNDNEPFWPAGAL